MRFKSLIRNKWAQWFLVLCISVQLPGTDAEGPLLYVILLWVFLFPLLSFSGAIWKTLRFFYFPSPLQLWKGFKRTWPFVRKGPVVTRIHLPPSPPTP